MPSMKKHIKPKIPNKDELEDLAKKYGVRYIGQPKRNIVDTLLRLRRPYMTITERKYMYPLATPTQKKLLRQTMKNRHRKIPF